MKKKIVLIIVLAVTAGFIAITSMPGAQDGKKEKPQSASSVPTNQVTAFWTKTFSVGIKNPTNMELSYNVKGRYIRAISKDKLNDATLLNDIIPSYPTNWMNAYRGVEISILYNREKTKTVSKNNVLTTEQKNMLPSAALTSKIEIIVKYVTKNSVTGSADNRQMELILTVIPETEAEFPGGNEKVIGYLKENSSKIISEKNPETFQNALILFNINEIGKITDVTLAATSGYTEIDNLLLEVIGKMPAWKPAENATGVKVKQEFEFTFGQSGC